MELFTFDDEYVRRLRERDPTTEEHFFAYERKLLGIKLRARHVAPEWIDDFIQDTLTRVLKAVREGRVTDGRTLGAYVNGTCNHVISEQTRKTRREEQLDDVRHDRANGTTTEEDFVGEEQKTLLRRAMNSLPPKDAELLKGVFIEERDKDAICAELGVSREYLRVLLHRAIGKIREKLVTKPSPPSLRG